MSKLVKGDVVLCVDDHSNYLTELGVYTVHEVGKGGNSDMVSLTQNNRLIGKGDMFFMNRFVKINGIVPDNIDAAKKLLEDAGYVVSKPKPVPEFGQVWKAEGMLDRLVVNYDPATNIVISACRGDKFTVCDQLERFHAVYMLDKS